MSWIQKLYETYERCKGNEEFSQNLLPLGHGLQQVHIEIRIDQEGNFRNAALIEGREETVIPVTEQSAGRGGTKPPPHPLADKIQYCAGDYEDFAGTRPSFFKEYQEQLDRWCQSPYSHPKAEAVYRYVNRKTLVMDLIREKILWAEDGKLLTRWTGDKKEEPPIFKNLAGTDKDQGNAVIRWRVHISGDEEERTWKDGTLQEKWSQYDLSQKEEKDICVVSGKEQVIVKNHPARIRSSNDRAKLISSNDGSGFTYRGRFRNSEEACTISYEVSQKAHNALRWLIERQSYRNSDQVYVAWALEGQNLPQPWVNSNDFFGEETEDETSAPDNINSDTGSDFAKRLALRMKGYRSELGSTSQIVIMGVDSATPGRMSIIYYRELTGSEFLDRIEKWHRETSWLQNYGKKLRFTGAPSPRDIAEAAYGRRLDDKLKKMTVERLLPCIIDGRSLPNDIVDSTIRRVMNRVGMENWEWEKNLGIACSLYRNWKLKEEEYSMSLETERNTRDYLFGRLLAIAEHLEMRALHAADEKRETNASRLFQRFSDRPCSTWSLIEKSLVPYRRRLLANRPHLLPRLEKLMDQVVCQFDPADFSDQKGRLGGEFLLGYHCQRQALWEKNDSAESDEN